MITVKHQGENVIRILKNSNRFQLYPQEIIRLEAEVNYTSLFTATDNFIIAKTLKKVEEQLDPDLFIRIHKSHLVNKRLIAGIDFSKENKSIILKTGESLTISRRRLKEVIRSINPY